MNLTLLIERDLFQTRSLLIREGELVDYELAAHHQKSSIGEIHYARISRFSDNIDGAFVELDDGRAALLLSRNCAGASSLQNAPIRTKVSEGQRLLVQIIKDAKDDKAAEVSARPTLDSRFVSYQPLGSGLQFPKGKLKAEQRDQLKTEHKSTKGRIIIRSRADEASLQVISADVQNLQATWTEIITKASQLKKSQCLYRPIPQLLAAALEHTNAPLEIISNDPSFREQIQNWNLDEKVIFKPWAKADLPISHLGYEADLAALNDIRVPLRSGGDITIEQTEAMAVIDVNTGRASAGVQLNTIAHRVNCEAAEEIARQLKFRNLSGIIIIDFIQMHTKDETHNLIDELRALTHSDPMGVKIHSMTELGLLQLTRKRTSAPLAHIQNLILPHTSSKITVQQASHLLQQLRHGQMMRKSAKLSLKIAPMFEPLLRNYHSAIENQLGVKIDWQVSEGLGADTIEILTPDN